MQNAFIQHFSRVSVMFKYISKKILSDNSLSPAKSLAIVIKKYNALGRLFGINIFQDNFTPFNVLFMLLVFDNCSYVIININSMIVFKDDFIKMIFCLVTLGE